MTESDWHQRYFAEPYGEIYAEYLLSPEAAIEEARFARQVLDLRPSDRVLDCPCGFGRHMAQLGILLPNVIGVDLDWDCLRRAKRAMPGPLLVRGDMLDLPLDDGLFGAVINLFNSFGYFSEEGNQRVLEEFARVLRPGGRLLIDVANSGPLLNIVRDRPRTQVETGDAVLIEDWRYERSSRRLHNKTRFVLAGKGVDRSYAVRLYDLAEIQAMLHGAGLQFLQAYGEFDGALYDEAESSRLIVTARR
ncbi:MAG TPA: class I SAM-dependent methyltransferase [Sumerlaeia bacterium]|nr:class I SAM-dependent methyltransferase [Sumerlaeia bacterium]